MTVELRGLKQGKKARVGSRNLKSSPFKWYLKPKDFIRSPREIIKIEKRIVQHQALHLLRSESRRRNG